MDQELGHAPSHAVRVVGRAVPHRPPHQRQVHARSDGVRLVEERRDEHRGVAVCVDAGQASVVDRLRSAHEVHEPAQVGAHAVDVAPHDRVHHRRARREVERHVVADHAAPTAADPALLPVRLDARVPHVDSRGGVAMALQGAGTEDAGQVVDVREVEDGRHSASGQASVAGAHDLRGLSSAASSSR